MIQQVGFKNFRRFAEFPAIDLGGINLFVGRNNAGKSTVLKAMMLMKGNLNVLTNYQRERKGLLSNSMPMFTFDVDQLASLHIDNLERALYNKAERKEITLSSTIDGCYFSIVLDGQNISHEQYFVTIPYRSIELKNDVIELKFNFSTRDLSLKIFGMSADIANSKLIEARNQYSATVKEEFRINDELKVIGKKIKASTDGGSDLVELLSRKEQLEKSKKNIGKTMTSIEAEIAKLEKEQSGETYIEVTQLPDFIDTVKVNVVAKVFEDIWNFASLKNEDKKEQNTFRDKRRLDGRTSEYKKEVEPREVILANVELLKNEMERFVKALSHFNLEYIHAHAASQKTIFLKEDKTDMLSVAIAEFCKSRIVPGDKEYTFIKKWMNGFGIGEDIAIKEIESAGYTLKIVEDGEELNLADKGTGSIQLMTLLFTLANIMHNVSINNIPAILIEEPEQNIHPMLQSKLADMFHDFRESFVDSFKPQLIIETHSEYLVRRTQLIVAEKEYLSEEDLLSDNPFKVFYFPSEKGKTPYDMEYQINGRFKSSFDYGFYDAAGTLSLQLSKKDRKEVKGEEFNWSGIL